MRRTISVLKNKVLTQSKAKAAPHSVVLSQRLFLSSLFHFHFLIHSNTFLCFLFFSRSLLLSPSANNQRRSHFETNYSILPPSLIALAFFPSFLFSFTKTTHMELDESPTSAPTSRLDHLAELATSPTHAHPSVSSSSSSFSSFAASNNNNSSSPDKERSFAHKHSHSHSESPMNESTSTHSRSHIILESESTSNWKSPITPTTTRKFNRMAIHGVLEGPSHPTPHPLDDGSRSPPYKRKGSPDEFSDPPSSR